MNKTESKDRQVNISMTDETAKMLFELMTRAGTFNRSAYIRALIEREWAAYQKKASKK